MRTPRHHLAAPTIPGLAHYRVLACPGGTTTDEAALLAAARHHARRLAHLTHGDPSAYTLLFHGAGTRRVPDPHVHIVPAAHVTHRRSSLFRLGFKGLLRRTAWTARWRAVLDQLVDAVLVRLVPRRPSSDDLTDLHPRLQAAWAAVGAEGAAPTEALCRAWSAPHRHYHGPSHLRALLAGLDRHAHLAVDPPSLELAIWFHDAVMVPLRRDDEARSAAWAERALTAAHAPDAALQVAALVRCTTDHHPREHADAALLIDLDLAVLGAPPEAYDAYVAGVRREHAVIPARTWRSGRRRVLEHLGQGGIYQTAAFRSRLESQAQRNLARELTSL